MGFYDARCMITGLNLRSMAATAVVLRRTGTGYRPITLGIHGTYDQGGSVDGVAPDANTDLILAYFEALAGGPRLYRPEDPALADPPPPDHAWFTQVEQVLGQFERNSGHLAGYHGPMARLDDDLVALALIAQPVWDALTGLDPDAPGPVEDQFRDVFGDEPVAAEIYRDHLTQVADEIRQAQEITRFLSGRDLPWLPWAAPSPRFGPVDVGAQYDLDDDQEFLAAARRFFPDVPALRPVFADVDHEIQGELLLEDAEDPDLPSAEDLLDNVVWAERAQMIQHSESDGSVVAVGFTGPTHPARVAEPDGPVVVEIPPGLVAALGRPWPPRVTGTLNGAPFDGEAVPVALDGLAVQVSPGALAAGGAAVGDHVELIVGPAAGS